MPPLRTAPEGDAREGHYGDVKRRALGGGRVLLGRHVVWALVALVGSTILIRGLGPERWASYSIAYYLTVGFDYAFGATFLGHLVRSDRRPDSLDRQTAAALMNRVGVAALVFFTAVAVPASQLYGRDELTGCLVGVGVCAFVYSLRSTSVALLERGLRYRVIAAAELLDQFTFYVVAIGLMAAGLGLTGVVAALCVRGLPSTVLCRRSEPVPWLGRLDRTRLHAILRFARPSLASATLIVATGLVPVVVLGGSHARELGFVMAAATIVGYAGTAQVIAQRIGFPSFSSLNRDPQRLGLAVRRTVAVTDTILVLLLLPVGALSPLWLPILLGRRWEAAGAVLIAMGVGFAFNAIPAIATSLLQALGQARRALFLQGAMILAYAGPAVLLTGGDPRLGVPLGYVASRIVGAGLALWLVERSGGSLVSASEVISVGLAVALMAGIGALADGGRPAAAVALAFAAATGWIVLRRGDLSAIRADLPVGRPRPAG
jgi:O-antigen/teichoic acid export membrane protein